MSKYVIEMHDSREKRTKRLREAAELMREAALERFEDKSRDNSFLRSNDLKDRITLAHELELVAYLLEDAKLSG